MKMKWLKKSQVSDLGAAVDTGELTVAVYFLKKMERTVYADNISEKIPAKPRLTQLFTPAS